MFGSNALINFMLSHVLKSKVEILFSISKVRFVGRGLLLTILMHCLPKKSLNKLVFAKKSVASQLPTDNGSIMVILEPFTKVFKIDE